MDCQYDDSNTFVGSGGRLAVDAICGAHSTGRYGWHYPRNLFEAATMDGATGLQTFWYLELPMLRPTRSSWR